MHMQMLAYRITGTQADEHHCCMKFKVVGDQMLLNVMSRI